MSARSTLSACALICLTVLTASACGGSSAKTSEKAAGGGDGSRAGSKSTACTFFHENEVATLFATRPQQTFDPYGIGGAASNCLWKANSGGEQYLLQIAIFNGVRHYDKSDKSGAQNLPGFGVKGFIEKGDIGGVTLEFVRANKTNFFLFSIAKTQMATRNDANAKADQLLALIKRNLTRLDG